MNNRYLGALIISPLLIFLFLGGNYLRVISLVVSLAGLYEFFKALKVKNINPMSIVAYIMCLIYYITIKKDINFQLVMFLIICSTLVMLCITVVNLKYNFIDVAVTILGFIYVSMFFSFIWLVSEKNNGNYLLWLIFISSWFCDSTAYYVGKSLGKNKLCPKVSPKKTIEGSIGGFLGSTIACGILGIIINTYTTTFPLYNYFIIGAICGVICQFGDLVASSIKRYVGIKDYSKLIPGHGGILDRFDSILFASVAVYYYITFIVGI